MMVDLIAHNTHSSIANHLEQQAATTEGIELQSALTATSPAEFCPSDSEAAMHTAVVEIQEISDSEDSHTDFADQLLLCAAHHILPAQFEQLLTTTKSLKGFSLNKIDAWGYQPSHHAASNNHAQLLKWLIRQNADLLKEKTPTGLTPCHLAAQHLNFESLREILQTTNGQQFSTCETTEPLDTPLHLLMRSLGETADFPYEQGDRLIKLFYPMPAAIFNQPNKQGHTPAYLLLKFGLSNPQHRQETIQHWLYCLLSSGKIDLTPGNSQERTISQLIEQKTSERLRKNSLNQMRDILALLEILVFLKTLSVGNQELMRLVQIEKPTAQNCTELREFKTQYLNDAPSASNPVRPLFPCLNRYQLQDAYFHCMPIHRAAWCGQIELLTLLLELDPTQFFVTAGGGYTPLHHACKNGQLEVVQRLIALYQKLVEKNLRSWLTLKTTDCAAATPSELALDRGHDAIVRFLSTYLYEKKFKPMGQSVGDLWGKNLAITHSS